MKKHKIVWLLAALLFVLCWNGAYAQSMKRIPVNFNDQASGLYGYVKGETVYAPARGVLELCCVGVHWDNAAKQAVINDGRSTTVIRQQGKQWYIDGALAGPEEEPMLYKGKLYLPCDFIRDFCDASISFSGDSWKAVDGINIQFPLAYVDGQWLAYDKPIRKAAAGANFMLYHVGDNVVGSDYLWILYPDGSHKQVTRERMIDEWLVKDNVCYYMFNDTFFSCSKCKFYAVDLETGKKTQLGAEDYFYNMSIRKDQSLYVLGNEPASLGSLITDKGIVTTGIAARAAIEEFVNNEELMRQTYGVYLLPLDGGEPVLQRLINID